MKDHADRGAAITGQFERRKRGEIVAIGEDGAEGGSVESSDEIEKCGFARARGAEKREKLVGGDGERDVVDGAYAGFAHGVVAGNVFEMDSDFGGGHGVEIGSQVASLMIRREWLLYFMRLIV